MVHVLDGYSEVLEWNLESRFLKEAFFHLFLFLYMKGVSCEEEDLLLILLIFYSFFLYCFET